MKLNIVSPVPPARTSIAGDLWHSLPALQEVSDVTLWTNHRDWDPELEQFADVRCFPETGFWHELHKAEMTVYHIGNNHEFHSQIWDISRRHPGVVILHDMALQHLFTGFFRVTNDTQGYLRLMLEHYGPEGARSARELLDGRRATEDVAREFPLTLPAIENALGVLVHSRDAFDRLARLKRWPVASAGLPFSPTARPGGVVPRGGGRKRRLIAFGFLGPNRRLDSILRALATVEERSSYQLDIYGSVWDPEHLEKLARSLGINELVTLHGFVPSEELEEAIEKADLAINLRFPTMGESSGSQLRIWDHALPSLVTRTGWYSELPDDTVAFVRQEHEVDDIRLQLQSLFSAPAALTHMGARGRLHLEQEHSPRAYARQIVDLARRAASFRAQASARLVARKIGSDGPMASLSPTSARRVSSRIISVLCGDDAGTIPPSGGEADSGDR